MDIIIDVQKALSNDINITDGLMLIIKNNGRTAARNIKLSTKKGYVRSDLGNHIAANIEETGIFKIGISVLPPQGKRFIGLSFLSKNTDYEALYKKSFDVKASYQDKYEEKIETSFYIDFKEIDKIEHYPDTLIEKSLKSISESISKIKL